MQESDAQVLVTATRDRALASGESLGLSADQIAKSIEAGTNAILEKRARTTDVKKEEADLGHVLLACAIMQNAK